MSIPPTAFRVGHSSKPRTLLSFVIFIVGLSLSLSYSSVAASNSFSLQLARYANECFFEILKTNDRLDVSFEVMTSSNSDFDIDYTISNPDGTLLHSFPRERQGSVGFNAVKEGTYQICFSNMRYNSEKVVTFTITGPDEQKLLPKMESDDASKTDESQVELYKAMQKLMDNIRFMRDEQSYLLRRHDRHRHTAESTFGRVFWWSLCQITLLVGSCIFQVFYLKHFFETKRVV
ncbi:hypothetical protein BASA50_001849 [Batrachochytrium salamandrivorans]|uniref:GOLD domain-containing protein n=1 Tax=Batrachochytrium salamandrivorans TaxID=1357716 RepID=A0ABQ8FN64_9FUNG|nr:hypothetical protein BASA62_008681 [Batrachochytrium salamandrivorans]KAH6582098.1 hypothetical protein BASA60_002149 [Batrachochytrium salamandrivorans]KAH6591183.1 hypothetical protein BASA61_005037 [Batrachochytrium salamandrivorans]KAH6601170.1 hypothetical protein BASA50_001849 [Batrachochytrium salamandrivorans]KAH9246968.1 hypothetical protein BASA81_015453 [Batrachochytrium salamandrivorans]